VIWLHTFGERFADPPNGRPVGAPRMPKGKGGKADTRQPSLL